MRDLFDEPISIVEELDPEPEPSGGWMHLRELILGVLLLVGVLVWSGWEWWQQDQNQASYLIAQQAADEQDWDRALQYFERVKGFKDADVRASEMNKLVTERNRQYEIASSSAEKGDWATTLQAAEAVRRVQPDYRDTRQLEAEASWEVYRGALQGVVALRTQSRNPALYYRSVNGWEWLARSDRQSQVLRTLDASGAIVYDVPGENWDQVKLTPTATPAPASLNVSGMPGLKGRALRVARNGNDGLQELGVNFDPSEHNFYWVGEKGMWAVRRDSNRINRRPRVIMAYGSILIDYQAFGSSKTVKLNVQPGWTYVDFAPDGEHLLLVDEGSISDSDPQAHGPLDLYLADGSGGNRKLLYSHEGSIQGVQFSPDSKYAMLTANSYKAGGTEIYKVVLIDIENNKAHLLIERELRGEVQGSGYPLPVAGTFIKEGQFAGHALVIEDGGDHGHLYLFAPDRPASAVLEAGIGRVPSGSVWTSQKDGSTLLAWQEQVGTFGNGTPLHILEIKPDMSTQEWEVPTEGKGFLAFSGVRDNWFVYGGREYGGGGGRPNLYSVYALPFDDLAAQYKMPAPIYSDGLPDVSGYPLARAIYPGPTMLSYAANGELHVRTYDSKVDMTLENGIQHLYDPLFNASWLQLR